MEIFSKQIIVIGHGQLGYALYRAVLDRCKLLFNLLLDRTP